MAFFKYIQSAAEPLSGVFAADHGALFGINGRLSGFYPIAVSGGDPGTPGICTTTLLDGTIQRYIGLTLSAPGASDDLRFPQGGQKTSAAIIDGTVVESDSPVQIDMILREPTETSLTDQVPIIVFMNLPSTSEKPTFGIERESVIDAGPQKIAKIAFYNPETQTWEPYPAVSLGGIYQRLLDIANRLGGFLVTKNSPSQMQVSPGFIVGQFGRIINQSVSIVSPLASPGIGKWRKDVLFVNDPRAENLPITFTTLKGFNEESSEVLAITAPPSRPNSPGMVSLAEIILNNSGVSSVIDIRPIQAWATDAAQQRDPDVGNAVNIKTVQPGILLADKIPNATPDWEVLLMRGKNRTNGIAYESKLVIGLTGPQVERTFVAPASGSLTFVPDATQFPVAPYVIESSFRVISVASGEDVTDNPAYAINFDFLAGRFVGTGVTPGVGITAQAYREQIRVVFRQLRVLFSFNDDRSVSIPELDLIRQHIASNSPFYLPENATNPNGLDISDDPEHRNLPFTGLPPNPKAHTGFNITVNNTALFLPGSGANPAIVSVQKAIEILASTYRPPPPNPLAGKRLSLNWRSGKNFYTLYFKGVQVPGPDDDNNPKFQGPFFTTYFGILEPAGGRFGFSVDPFEPVSLPTAIPAGAAGVRFPFSSGKVIGGSFALVARKGIVVNPGTPAPGMGPPGPLNDGIFTIWIDNQRIDVPALTRTGGAETVAPMMNRGTFTMATPVPISNGQTVRIGMYSSAQPPADNGKVALQVESFSADIFVELI